MATGAYCPNCGQETSLALPTVRSMLREAVARDIDLAVEGAFAFDGARCDRIVAGVFDRIELEAPG